jgi:hypothetical protein
MRVHEMDVQEQRVAGIARSPEASARPTSGAASPCASSDVNGSSSKRSKRRPSSLSGDTQVWALTPAVAKPALRRIAGRRGDGSGRAKDISRGLASIWKGARTLSR